MCWLYCYQHRRLPTAAYMLRFWTASILSMLLVACATVEIWTVLGRMASAVQQNTTVGCRPYADVDSFAPQHR